MVIAGVSGRAGRASFQELIFDMISKNQPPYLSRTLEHENANEGGVYNSQGTSAENATN